MTERSEGTIGVTERSEGTIYPISEVFRPSVQYNRVTERSEGTNVKYKRLNVVKEQSELYMSERSERISNKANDRATERSEGSELL